MGTLSAAQRTSRVLFIAPVPFFAERGTPIAVKLAVEALAELPLEIDLLTYREGSEVPLPTNVRHLRPYQPRFLFGSRPGFSLRKLLLDIPLFLLALWKLLTTRYDFVHGVEEAGVFAGIVAPLFGVKAINDMDSKMLPQVVSSWRFLKPLTKLLVQIEAVAMRRAAAAITMCEELAQYASSLGARATYVVTDPSLLVPSTATENLRETAQVPATSKVILYVGNLERYQGIDLLLASIAELKRHRQDFFLIILGGSEPHRQRYHAMVQSLGIDHQVALLGPRPVRDLAWWLSQADVLVSPRTTDANTPMKIYSYLHAGKPIVATNLSTHTQVLASDWAVLCEPIPSRFAEGLALVLENQTLANAIAERAKQRAEQFHTPEVFKKNMVGAYRELLLLNPRRG